MKPLVCAATLALVTPSALAQGQATTPAPAPQPAPAAATPSKWSIGGQLGPFGLAGISAQNISVGSGALNLGVGAFWGSLLISGDYLWLFTSDFDRLPYGVPSYASLRGKWTPYVGLGAGAGWGLILRAPAGVQYTTADGEFNFFGNLTLFAGWGLHIGAEIGARKTL